MGRPLKDAIDERAVAACATAKLRAVVRAARILVFWIRHTSTKGLYRIPPGCLLALCQAIDEADDIAKGGE